MENAETPPGAGPNAPAAGGAGGNTPDVSAVRRPSVSVSCMSKPSPVLSETLENVVRYKRYQKYAFVFVVLLGACVVFLVILYLALISPSRTVYCETEACLQHAAELSATLDLSVHPCSNFRRFVCGRSQPWAGSMEEQMAARAADAVLAELEQDTERARKPTKFFHSCTSGPHRRRRGLAQFTEFRRKLGLVWPEDSRLDERSHPVDVMMNLAVKWNMNFLFEVRVLPDASGNSSVLLITPGRLGVVWRARLRLLRSTSPDQYGKRVDLHYYVLSVKAQNVSHAQLQKLEQDIVGAKVESVGAAQQQSWFPLAGLDRLVPSAEGRLSVSRLNDHFRGQVNWTPKHIAIVQSARILQNVEKLITAHGSRWLLVGLSWIFIQSHLWAVMGMPELMFPGEAQKWEKHACLEYVDKFFGPLAAAQHLVRRLTARDEVYDISRFFEKIRRSVNTKLDGLSATDAVGVTAAKRKVSAIKISALPARALFSDSGREDLYRSFPPQEGGERFISTLIGLSELHRNLRLHNNYLNLYSKHMFSDYGDSIYIYPTNYLEIPLLTLEPPLYYMHVAFGINYAGLGGVVARNLCRAFDRRGVTIDETGEEVQWWVRPPSGSRKANVECGSIGSSSGANESELSERLFRSALALDVAFSAFRDAVSRGHVPDSDVKIRGFFDYTENQIFFITYCHVLCAYKVQAGSHDDDECMYAMKNFKPFAEAFNCPAGTPMNPTEKCTFFAPTPPHSGRR
ncbi:neprilysin-1-like [Haemaphysalis longicornis]